MMGQTHRHVRATFDRVTDGEPNVSQETVTRRCSRCRTEHAGKHYYCDRCRAIYMQARRVIWKAKRDSRGNLDAARAISESEAHE